MKYNIFKTLIPKNDAQEVTELESFTVKWKYDTDWSGATETKHKVFIKKEEAEEFKKQLISSAKLIGCWIETEMYKN